MLPVLCKGTDRTDSLVSLVLQCLDENAHSRMVGVQADGIEYGKPGSDRNSLKLWTWGLFRSWLRRWT